MNHLVNYSGPFCDDAQKRQIRWPRCFGGK